MTVTVPVMLRRVGDKVRIVGHAVAGDKWAEQIGEVVSASFYRIPVYRVRVHRRNGSPATMICLERELVDP